MPGTKRRNPVTVVVVITPLVIIPFLLLGVYLGFYLGDIWDYSKTLLAVVFSAIGLIVSFTVIIRMIGRLVACERPTT